MSHAFFFFFLLRKLSVISGSGRHQNRTKNRDNFFSLIWWWRRSHPAPLQGSSQPNGVGRDTCPLTYSLSKELPGLTYLFAMFAIKGSATFLQKGSYSSGSGVRQGDDSQLYLGAVVFTVSSASNISSLGLDGATSLSPMKRLHLPCFMFCLPNPSLLMGAESN